MARKQNGTAKSTRPMILGTSLETPPGVGAQIPLPALSQLYKRHKGYPKNQCGAYADAACVCLSRHHKTPQLLKVQDGTRTETRSIAWTTPNAKRKAAWNNSDDATRDGAYAVSLAAVEQERRLVAVGRALALSGADWLLRPADSADAEDFESIIRLEVSGVDDGSLGARFNQKVDQAKKGDSDLPAIVSVVGFKRLQVRIGDVDLSEPSHE